MADIFKMLKEKQNKQTKKPRRIKTFQLRILYPEKLHFEREGKIKTFPEKQKLKESITTRPAF